MVILSLFDGISCGRVALERAGIPITKYYASEVDKHAIKIAQANHPDTIQLGDVRSVYAADLPKIDILLAGSPCQGFSFAGKQLAFDDPRSALFFEFVRLLKECKPKYFLLENVKMVREHLDVITQAVGVAPVLINSALVSAQNRERYYWFGEIEKKLICEFDIVHEYEADEKRTIQAEAQGARGAEVLGKAQRRYISLQNCQNNEKALPKTNYRDNEKADGSGYAHDNANENRVRSLPHKKRPLYRPHSSIIKGWNEQLRKSSNTVQGMRFIEEGQNDDGVFRLFEIKVRSLGNEYDLFDTFIGQPGDKGILLKDILEDDVEFYLKLDKQRNIKANQGKASCLTGGGHSGGNHSDMDIIAIKDKSGCIRTGGRNSPLDGQHDWDSPFIYQRGHGFNKGGVKAVDGKTPAMTSSKWQDNNYVAYGAAQRGRNIVNGKRVDEKGSNYTQIIEVSENQKANALTSVQKNSMVARNDNKCNVLVDTDYFYYRRLTVTECERLQTLPDFYTQNAGVSKTQQYKALGNGWTVDVVVHILQGIAKDIQAEDVA